MSRIIEPQVVPLEQRSGAFTLSKMRKLEKENEASTHNLLREDMDDSQRELERESERSKTSMVDQAY